MKASVSYSPGDKIFAKVKGHPHWPSRINLLPPDVSIPKGKYPIFFYGTHEVYFLAPKDIFPYEKFKHKYGIKRNKAVFQAGLEEIEKNPDVLLYGKDPQAESFLARFYTFQRAESASVPSITTNKRPNDSDVIDADVSSRPAKRSRSDVGTNKRKSVTTPAGQHRKPGGRSSIKPTPPSILDSTPNTNTQSIVPTPTIETFSEESPNNESHDHLAPEQKRVSSLRLRIRKNSHGLKLSPNPQSSLSSPSTPNSNVTLEAKTTQPEELAPPASPEPLKITIRQNSKSTLSVFQHSKEKDISRPVVPVTPTRNMAINIDPIRPEINRRKSTAVVTPLRRNQVLPELSDDSSDSSVDSPNQIEHKSAKSSSDISNSTTRLTLRPPSSRLKKKSEKLKAMEESEAAVAASLTGELGEDTSPHGSWSTGSWPKTPSNSSNTKSSSKAPEKTVKTPEAQSTTENKGSNSVQEKLQYLKDLSTEARLILIDRAIKSSLTQGHEDITTCIDLLEMLDKMSISLPVMAKCWSVIDTIRKCRRYKRSLEVKIAAHKVFNKFLQLYATADKNELDLAHAELVKHQQLYAKQHATDDPKSTPHSPYTGPKSMAELLQVSSCPLPDRRRPPVSSTTANSSTPDAYGSQSSIGPTEIHTSSSTVTRPSRPLATDKLPSSSASAPSLAIKDIPLPEEPQTHLSEISKPTDQPAGTDLIYKDPFEDISSIENIEDYFELLDEYKAPDDGETIEASCEVQSPSPVSASLDTAVFQFPPRQSLVSSCANQHPNFPVPAVPTVNSYPNLTSQKPSYPPQYHPTTKNHQSPHTHVAPPSIEATPPQCASIAYVPHSIHPSTDPPPPYKPYIPTRCDLDDAYPHSMSKVVRKEVVGPKNHSSTRVVADMHARSPRDDRVSHGARDFRSPPHRARSPHALPHPLAHYQRYLNSALSPDEMKERSRIAANSRADMQVSIRSGSCRSSVPGIINEPNDTQRDQDDASDPVLSRTITEDLDARIERLFNFAARKSGLGSTKPNDTEPSHVQQKIPNHEDLPKFGSPPPPPPPLPASQRILFTHKPQQHSPVLHRDGAVQDTSHHPVPIAQSSKQGYPLPYSHPPINQIPVDEYDNDCPPAIVDNLNTYKPGSPNYLRPVDPATQHRLGSRPDVPYSSARQPDDRHHKYNFNSHQNQFFRRSAASNNNRFGHQQHNQYNRRPFPAPSGANYSYMGYKTRAYSGRSEFGGGSRDFRNRQQHRSGRDDRNMHSSMSGGV